MLSEQCALGLVLERISVLILFFFSSRRRHTRSKRDWSSDVCSSDLTARLWADLGFWRITGDGDASFQIHGVTGPAEYTTVVNNNMVTNVMARHNLRRAARAVRQLRTADRAAYDSLVAELGLDELELEQRD